jgi:phosphatidylglycerophosphate synthase
MAEVGHPGARLRIAGPDGLTLARVPAALAIVAVALSHEPSRPLLGVLFGFAIATDVADGWWARHAGIASDRGAKLDSLADAAVTAAVAVALFATTVRPVAPWVLWGAGAVGVVRMATLGITFARFRVVSIAHTWGNKAAGVGIAAAALWVLGSGRLDTWPVAVAYVVAGAAAIDELGMAASSRAYDRDRRGWWHAERSSAGPQDAKARPQRN